MNMNKDLKIIIKHTKIITKKKTNKTELNYLLEYHKIKKIANCEYATQDIAIELLVKNLNSIYYFANDFDRIKLIHSFAIKLHSNFGNGWHALINSYTKDATRRLCKYKFDKLERKAKYKK